MDLERMTMRELVTLARSIGCGHNAERYSKAALADRIRRVLDAEFGAGL